MKRTVLYFAAAVLLCYIAALFFFDPREVHVFPGCPLSAVTGLKCAGCGGQRALHCLMHGEVAEAFGYNRIVFFLPFLFGVDLFIGRFVNRNWLPYILLFSLILYSVARNIPGLGL